ncbi:hypothetical protein Caka_3083 [Coraliomargarita akajimensis DSM 45221]|uniref:Uncharacterized protein n=1 Tax=Coraliomargarita akajimensis (strain DSM 45221 / IAM 15411 / JCM 23193 / KCTC 12865 / 04OKA010-24) TaxID=583355 RepID=D5EI56_CORAD|nr:hypothetical protein Caka_3083 [Coraliomargarita akajimensis DSM 45221]
MRIIGNYPPELCREYAKALRAAGIKCREVQQLTNDLSLSTTPRNSSELGEVQSLP